MKYTCTARELIFWDYFRWWHPFAVSDVLLVCMYFPIFSERDYSLKSKLSRAGLLSFGWNKCIWTWAPFNHMDGTLIKIINCSTCSPIFYTLSKRFLHNFFTRFLLKVSWQLSLIQNNQSKYFLPFLLCVVYFRGVLTAFIYLSSLYFQWCWCCMFLILCSVFSTVLPLHVCEWGRRVSLWSWTSNLLGF